MVVIPDALEYCMHFLMPAVSRSDPSPPTQVRGVGTHDRSAALMVARVEDDDMIPLERYRCVLRMLQGRTG